MYNSRTGQKFADPLTPLWEQIFFSKFLTLTDLVIQNLVSLIFCLAGLQIRGVTLTLSMF